MFLVDTNVLSAGAPTKTIATPGLAAWMDRNSSRLYLSVITVAELEDGIARSRRHGANRKADQLADWLETLLHLYSTRILPVDLLTARRIGILADQARGLGHAPGLADLTIAATAQGRGYTILTRDLRHFDRLGVPAIDPFENLTRLCWRPVCVFRRKAASDSDRMRPLIPAEGGHRFQSKAATLAGLGSKSTV